MDVQNTTDEKKKSIEEAENDHAALQKDLVATGELVTLDNGVPIDMALTELPAKEQARILRKIDFRVLPLLVFLYLCAYIDRNNSESPSLARCFGSGTDLTTTVGNAKVAGLTDDLNIVGLQYNGVVSIFFVPYTLLEVPSNIILKLTRPSLWISCLLFSWGLVMTLMGTVTSRQGLYAARFFLGVAEAGFFPAASFLLTMWYKRYEYQRREYAFRRIFPSSRLTCARLRNLLCHGVAVWSVLWAAGLCYSENGWYWDPNRLAMVCFVQRRVSHY